MKTARNWFRVNYLPEPLTNHRDITAVALLVTADLRYPHTVGRGAS